MVLLKVTTTLVEISTSFCSPSPGSGLSHRLSLYYCGASMRHGMQCRATAADSLSLMYKIVVVSRILVFGRPRYCTTTPTHA